jgi:hypothetical protein
LIDDVIPTPQDFGLPKHYRPRQWSTLWEEAPRDWRHHLASALECDLGNHRPNLFFRADDIGAGGRPFQALCRLFRDHHIPLAMAVVPAWLTDIRTKQLFAAAPIDEPLWGWHQHGWRHVNSQRTGEKSEFGEQRPAEKQWRDICMGLKKMNEIFGERLLPVFTPPWNRLPTATLRILQELGFKAVSMTKPFPSNMKASIGLKNLRIQIDLHTRKAKDGHADFLSLLGELSGLMNKKEPVGIMLHHQRMTLFAFEFLNELLGVLKQNVGAQFLSFADLLANEYDK